MALLHILVILAVFSLFLPICAMEVDELEGEKSPLLSISSGTAIAYDFLSELPKQCLLPFRLVCKETDQAVLGYWKRNQLKIFSKRSQIQGPLPEFPSEISSIEEEALTQLLKKTCPLSLKVQMSSSLTGENIYATLSLQTQLAALKIVEPFPRERTPKVAEACSNLFTCILKLSKLQELKITFTLLPGAFLQNLGRLRELSHLRRLSLSKRGGSLFLPYPYSSENFAFLKHLTLESLSLKGFFYPYIHDVYTLEKLNMSLRIPRWMGMIINEIPSLTYLNIEERKKISGALNLEKKMEHPQSDEDQQAKAVSFFYNLMRDRVDSDVEQDGEWLEKDNPE